MHLLPAPTVWDLFRYYWYRLTTPEPVQPPVIDRFLQPPLSLRRQACPKCGGFEVINIHHERCFDCFRGEA